MTNDGRAHLLEWVKKFKSRAPRRRPKSRVEAVMDQKKDTAPVSPDCGQCGEGIPVAVCRIGGKDVAICEACMGPMTAEAPTMARPTRAIAAHA